MSSGRFARTAAALAAVALTAAAAPAAAQGSRTLTFDALGGTGDGSGVTYVDNCYMESGFTVSVADMACGASAALATWTEDNPLFYSGSAALFSAFGPSVDFTTTNGRAFSLFSVDLTSYLGLFGNPTTVVFTGMLRNGGMVTQSFDVMGGTTTPERFMLDGFRGLTSARLTVTNPDFEPYVQFDNVNASVVPEPATVTLMGVGLVGLAAIARRRRPTTR